MIKRIPSAYRVPVAIAVFLHVVLLIVLAIKLPASHQYRLQAAQVPVRVVQAVAVNQAAINREMQNIKRAEQRKRRAEQARLRQLRRQAAALKRKRFAEQKRLAQLKADQFRLKKQEKVKRRKQLLVKQQQLQQKIHQQQMLEEQKRLTEAHASQMQGIVNQYKAQIIQAIQQQWIVPSDADRQLSCVFLIHLAPGGVVITVKMLQSSGDPVLDRSARTAVFKASPLPVPKDPAVFTAFRDLRLTVRPLHNG